MATFGGTIGSDLITRVSVSDGVASDPPGSLPSDSGDIYNLYDGNDTLVAGDGPDDIIAGFGDDEVDAGGGDDVIWESVLWTESGDDRFSGGAGEDQIAGGAGDDLIDGGDDDDALYGGDEDRLWDEDGDDRIFGGRGNDLVAGGLGTDEIDGDDGNDILYAGNAPNDFFMTLVDTSANILRGGSGNDQLFGELGNDVLLGGQGDDFFYGEAGDDRLNGGDGNDFLYGNAGDDRLNGGDGNDVLDGGDGADRYTGFGGDDVFAVRDFDDTGETLVLQSEFVYGGSGIDTLLIDLTNVMIDLGTGIVQWDGDVDARLTLRSIEAVECTTDLIVRGSNGADSIISDGDSRLYGLGGDDFIQSNYAAVVAFGDTGDDTVIGGGRSDRLYGNGGADVLHGRNGNDRLYGGAGNDKLYGNTGPGVGGGIGSDRLSGGSGNDVLNGNYDSDELYGGSGRDTFLYTNPADSKYDDIDHIRGKVAFQAPGAGRGDIIDLRAIDADDSRGGNQRFIFHSEDQGGLWLKNIGDVTVVHGNIDRDRTAEFVLYIHDGERYRAEDYLASDFIL